MKITSRQQIERELLKRQAPKVESNFKLEDYLFKEQLDFVKDPSPYKTAVCSRRSGKTISCAAHLVHTAISFSDINCLYITLSRVSGKKIIWKELLKLNKIYNLGARVDNTELSLSFPNGSSIYVSGAKDQTEIEKFRGLALKLVYVDESQSFKH